MAAVKFHTHTHTKVFNVRTSIILIMELLLSAKRVKMQIKYD